MNVKPFLIYTFLWLSLSGCISVTPLETVDAAAPIGQASLPVFQGWYDGRAVYYLITDATDVTFARGMGANTASRLADTLTQQSRPAGTGKAAERVYVTEDPLQAKIFASAPRPIGSESKDANYSPVWQVFAVEWHPSALRHQLRSEEDVLSAMEHGLLTITATRNVINCPIIGEVDGTALPGVKIKKR